MTALWGHSPDHADAHAAAARLQHLNPGVVVWFGERSHTWYAMDAAGLHEATSIDDLIVWVWQRTHRPPEPRRPRSAWSPPKWLRRPAWQPTGEHELAAT